MKRISLLIMVILTVVPSVTKGYYYHNSSYLRYRVRWSPYAFGLVSGDLRYSPYAYKYGHSGLVPYWVRYSPYAFSHKHPSGLISDYSSSIYYSPRQYSYKDSGRVAYNCSDNRYNVTQTQESYKERLEARKQRITGLRQARKQINKTIQTDGMEIISRYLKNNNIDFRTNRILKIDNKTISVDFLLEDNNIIIKYWNPEEILFLQQQQEYKRNYYEKYLKEWKDFCQEYMKAGGKIHQIISAKEQEILAKLMLCDKLNDA